MERDFMGLSKRQPLRKVKPEVHRDGFSQFGFCKSSAMELTKFHRHQDFTSARELHEARVFPAASSVLKRSNFGGLNQNATAPAAVNAKPLLLGGAPMTSPSPLLPSLNSFAGFLDPRNNVAYSSAPQLTVFYAGTVNVFNDISPEKAQAIMLWAGKGPLLSNAVLTNAVADAISASSSSGTHCAENVSIGIDKPIATKAIDLMSSFCAASNTIPSVPQARKASLARFLEKRKERLMNAMPYSMSKMKLMDCSPATSAA